jgi:saccharopepsin
MLTLTEGVQIPGQVFHEIKYYEDVYYDPATELPLDGVLQLAVDRPWPPHFQGSRNILPSPFRSMIDHSLLAINMFSIALPTKEREQGSLTFGGYDEN